MGQGSASGLHCVPLVLGEGQGCRVAWDTHLTIATKGKRRTMSNEIEWWIAPRADFSAPLVPGSGAGAAAEGGAARKPVARKRALSEGRQGLYRWLRFARRSEGAAVSYDTQRSGQLTDAAMTATRRLSYEPPPRGGGRHRHERATGVTA